jgi:hypothetical protein
VIHATVLLIKRRETHREGNKPFLPYKESSMTTGKVPASKAGKELRNKKSARDEKTVAASDLTQAKTRKHPRHQRTRS